MFNFDYLEDVIVECAEDLKKNHSYFPGNDQLFKVVKDSPRLPTEDTDLFNCQVTRPLFQSKRTRSDMQVFVVFLCTRMKSPREQD